MIHRIVLGVFLLVTGFAAGAEWQAYEACRMTCQWQGITRTMTDVVPCVFDFGAPRFPANALVHHPTNFFLMDEPTTGEE